MKDMTTTDYSFQTLHADIGPRVIFRGVVGSRAYGTNRPGSDENVRGVFLVPPVEYELRTRVYSIGHRPSALGQP